MKQSFVVNVIIFLVIFLSLAAYMVGGLETEDGQTLLYLVLIGGLISTARAVYVNKKRLRQQLLWEEKRSQTLESEQLPSQRMHSHSTDSQQAEDKQD